jgi:hypothetical protein
LAVSSRELLVFRLTGTRFEGNGAALEFEVAPQERFYQ